MERVVALCTSHTHACIPCLPIERCLEVPNTAYTMAGMKDAYKPYTGGRLAKRAYAKPAHGSSKHHLHLVTVHSVCTAECRHYSTLTKA